MGLYSINCISCGKLCMWFSGNVSDQRCSDCKNKPVDNKESEFVSMTLEQQLIDTLKSAIAAKDDLIDHLKKEIQRLNSVANLPITVPNSFPNQQGTTPYVQPYYPGQPFYPYTPNPLLPPYIVTSGETTGPGSPNVVFTGEMPPLGSIQFGTTKVIPVNPGNNSIAATAVDNEHLILGKEGIKHQTIISQNLSQAI